MIVMENIPKNEMSDNYSKETNQQEQVSYIVILISIIIIINIYIE